MACEVWFYHLEKTELDQALPDLLEKTLAKGWRALVTAGSRERVEELDERLWRYRDDSFLAHGVSDAPNAAKQPILLTMDSANLNHAKALFLLEGAPSASLDGYERCIVPFDGRSETALAEARRRWSAFKAAGSPVSYWRQTDRGGWEKSA